MFMITVQTTIITSTNIHLKTSKTICKEITNEIKQNFYAVNIVIISNAKVSKECLELCHEVLLNE